MDKYAKKRALLITKYWRWAWHFRLDGTMFIRHLSTGQVIEVGRVE